MKQFYFENRIKVNNCIRKLFFYLLSAIACLIVLQTGLKVIPLFESDFSLEFSENLNIVLLSLSLSYIAGLIFYLFINYFPEKSKQRVVLNIVNPKIDIIVNDSLVFIAYLSKLYINSDKYLNLKLSDFSKITKFSNNKMGFSYFDGEIYGSTCRTEYEEYILIQEFTVKTIDDFFRIPSAIYLPEELIEILGRIRDCGLFQLPDSKNSPLDILNFDKQLFEYYSLLVRLSKYVRVEKKYSNLSVNYSYHDERFKKCK